MNAGEREEEVGCLRRSAKALSLSGRIAQHCRRLYLLQTYTIRQNRKLEKQAEAHLNCDASSGRSLDPG
jgi:hypothetical protein